MPQGWVASQHGHSGILAAVLSLSASQLGFRTTSKHSSMARLGEVCQVGKEKPQPGGAAGQPLSTSCPARHGDALGRGCWHSCGCGRRIAGAVTGWAIESESN